MSNAIPHSYDCTCASVMHARVELQGALHTCMPLSMVSILHICPNENPAEALMHSLFGSDLLQPDMCKTR